MTHQTMIVVDNGKNFAECRCGFTTLRFRENGTPFSNASVAESFERAGEHIEDAELTAMERHDRRVFGRSE